MAPSGQSYAEVLRSVIATPEFVAASPEQRIRSLLGVSAPDDVRFYSPFMRRCRLDSVTRRSPTTVAAVFRFTVDRVYCNGSGTLHGGAQAFIYDILTSLAVQALGTPQTSWINGGVSRTLNVTYMRPAPEGLDVLCEVEVLQVGKSLSFLRGVMKRANDGALVSACEHNKVVVPSKL